MVTSLSVSLSDLRYSLCQCTLSIELQKQVIAINYLYEKVFFPVTYLEVIGKKKKKKQLASQHREESQEKTMSKLQSRLNIHSQRCIMAGEWSELCGPS